MARQQVEQPPQTILPIDYTSTPTLGRFHLSTAFYRGILGPIGSGKSSAMCIEIMARARQQAPDKRGKRRTKFAVIRNTYSQLQDTTMVTWTNWFPEWAFGRIHRTNYEHNIRIDDLELDILFRALDRPDHVANLLSLELTGAWINEAREIPHSIVMAVGDRVGRYPSAKSEGGCTWNGVMMDTNPPDSDHWWPILADRDVSTPYGKELINSVLQSEDMMRQAGLLLAGQKVMEFFRQPGGMLETGLDKDGMPVFQPNLNAENLENLKPGYYITAMAGKSVQHIRVYYCAQYGFSFDGKPIVPEYRDQVHCTSSEVKPMKGIPIQWGCDWGLCYSDDTEVLTKSGWKLFKDVDEKADHVATLNPIGFGVEYTPINFKVEYDYEGDLLEFKSQNFDFFVTPEHRTPFTYRDTPKQLHFTSAEELSQKTTAHRYIQLYGNWKGHPMNLFGLPETIAARFLGWYVAEGSIEKKGTNYRVSISQKKPSLELDSLMTHSAWQTKWHKSSAGWRGTVPPSIGEELSKLGKAWTKHVPQSVKDAGCETIKNFLLSYVAGDGNIRCRAKKSNGVGRKVQDAITAATVSKQLLDDLQELAMKAGWATSVYIEKAKISIMSDGRKIPSPQIFRITFKRFDRAEILPNHVRRLPYKGKIYCLNVPHHTLYIRRNGRTCWNGNTPACTFSQRMPSGRIVVLDEIVTEDMGVERFANLFVSEVNKRFPGCIFADGTGDPAGEQRSQTDELTPFQIFNGVLERAKMPIRCYPAPTNDFTIRREAIAHPLTRIIDGHPGLTISPKCAVLRKALSGGYCYKRMKVSGDDRYHDKPDKNKFSHVAEACGYMNMGMGEGVSLVRGEPEDEQDETSRRRPVAAASGRSRICGY